MTDEKQEVQTVVSSATGNQMQGGDSSDPLASMNDEQRDEWLSTGKLPGSEPEKKTAAAESSTDGDKGKKTEGDGNKVESSTAPASGKTAADEGKSAEASTAKAAPRAEKGEGARERIVELNTENRILKERLAKIEGKKAPEGVTEGGAKPPAEAAAKPAPKMEDFDTLEEYVAAAVKHGTEEALATERKRTEDLSRTAQQRQREEAANKMLDDTLKIGKEKHADFNEVFTDDLPIIEGSTLDRWLADSSMSNELRAEVMYHYGSNREELAALNNMPSAQALRELVKLEIKLSTSESANKNDETKPGAAAPKKEKPVSQAPPPGSEVGAHGTPNEDPRAKAIASGDVAKYMEIENRRELAKTSRS